MLSQRQHQVKSPTTHYPLHDKHASQLSLLGLKLFGQILAPRFKPRVKLAQLSQLGLLRQRLIKVGGMIEVVQEVTTDLAQRRDMGCYRSCSSCL